VTKYLKRTNTDGISSYNPEGTRMFIPGDPMNTDYARMMKGVNADPPTNTIEEVDDTPE
jgi:hypothetical protein